MKTCWFIWIIAALMLSFQTIAAPLPANDVFKLSVKTLDPNSLELAWDIKPGYFLYQEKFKFQNPDNSDFNLGKMQLPEAENKQDATGRTVKIYRHEIRIPVSVLGKRPGEELLNVHYQGCSDEGFCYPPEDRLIQLTFNSSQSLTNATIEPQKDIEDEPQSQNDPENIFKDHHWVFVLMSFFGFGILLSFTPCVLPMVPVLSGMIVGHGPNLSTRKAFLLSLSYVLSMAMTYALVGIVVALIGSNLQIVMQSPLFIGLFSLIFVLLALSMFNFYELRLPLSWQNKLANISRGRARGHYLSAAIMGALSTLILSPCVTAPLVGALGYIAHTGNIVLGAVALFFLGLGMGAPLLLVGMSAGRWLPKAGIWMNAVKMFFGILLLGVAINLLSRIIPPSVSMLLWGSLSLFCGIYLGALQKAQSNIEKFAQGLGILLFLYGVLIVIGVSKGNINPFQPLASPRIKITTPIQTASTVSEVQKILALKHKTPLLMDFYADWCASCKQMAQTTLQNTEVRKALQRFNFIKVDLTENNKETKALLRGFNVIAPPTFLILDAEGHEISGGRLVGEASPQEFLQYLNRVS